MKCKELVFLALLGIFGNSIEADRPVEEVLDLVIEIRSNIVNEIVEAIAPNLNHCCLCEAEDGKDQGKNKNKNFSRCDKDVLNILIRV